MTQKQKAEKVEKACTMIAENAENINDKAYLYRVKHNKEYALQVCIELGLSYNKIQRILSGSM